MGESQPRGGLTVANGETIDLAKSRDEAMSGLRSLLIDIARKAEQFGAGEIVALAKRAEALAISATGMIPFSSLDLANALEGVVYILDRQRRFVSIGHGFTAFAEANGAIELTETVAVLGRSIFDFIEGEDVRAAYRRLFELVESACLDVGTVVFRCDSPVVERTMRLAVTTLPGAGGFLCQSILLNEGQASRAPIALFDFRARTEAAAADPDLPLLGMCSMCQQVRFPAGSDEQDGVWVTAEEYYARGGHSEVHLTHGFCPPCSERWQDQWLVPHPGVTGSPIV